MDPLKYVESDIDMLRTQINNLRMSIFDLTSIVGDLSTIVSRQAKEIAELKSRVDALEEKGLGF